MRMLLMLPELAPGAGAATGDASAFFSAAGGVWGNAGVSAMGAAFGFAAFAAGGFVRSTGAVEFFAASPAVEASATAPAFEEGEAAPSGGNSPLDAASGVTSEADAAGPAKA